MLHGKKNPYSAGPYPLEFVDTNDPSQLEEGYCKGQDFALHRTGTSYDKKPDLVVDVRSLLDRAPADCTRLPGPCLKVFTSTPNVGDGDLLLVAPFATVGPEETAVASPVSQVIARPDGTFTEVIVDGDFFLQGTEQTHRYTSGHRWVTLRLRKYDPDLCYFEADADNCPVVREGNDLTIGDCLYDATTFDPQYTPERSHSGCSLSRFDHNGGLYFREGIGAGRAALRAGGDNIDIGGLPPGDYWLEAEVNADRTIMESDYDNNVARMRIVL